MVTIVAQLVVRIILDTYMLYMNLFCCVQFRFSLNCKKLISWLLFGCRMLLCSIFP